MSVRMSTMRRCTNTQDWRRRQRLARHAWLRSRQALASVTAPDDQARLLMCRARVRSNQWLTHKVCEDAVAAMTLFDVAGCTELAVAAASLGAAHLPARRGYARLGPGERQHPGPGFGPRRTSPVGDHQSPWDLLLLTV